MLSQINTQVKIWQNMDLKYLCGHLYQENGSHIGLQTCTFADFPLQTSNYQKCMTFGIEGAMHVFYFYTELRIEIKLFFFVLKDEISYF